MDTLGIENLPGTPYTEGPKLTDSLKSHVGEYDIDPMDLGPRGRTQTREGDRRLSRGRDGQRALAGAPVR